MADENRYYKEYLKQLIKDNKPLEAAEEKELLILSRAGNEDAREQLVKHNLRLVMKLVNSIGYKNEEQKMEYFDSGVEALIRAIDGFDFSKAGRLSSYAQPIIFRSLDFEKSQEKGLSQHYARQFRAIMRAATRYEDDNKSIDFSKPEDLQALATFWKMHVEKIGGKPVSGKTIAKTLEMIHLANTVSLNTPVGESENNELTDVVEDTKSSAFFDFESEAATKAIALLPPLERKFITLMKALTEDGFTSKKERIKKAVLVSKKMNISPEKGEAIMAAAEEKITYYCTRG